MFRVFGLVDFEGFRVSGLWGSMNSDLFKLLILTPCFNS